MGRWFFFRALSALKLTMMKSNRWSRISGAALALCVPALAVAAVELPHVFKAGDKLSAAEMNENFEALRAKVAELEQRLDADWSHVSVNHVSPFRMPDDGFATVPYSSENMDQLDEYAKNTFTAKEDGNYLVCASLVPAESVPSYNFELDLFVNDARGPGFAYSSGLRSAAAGCTVQRLVRGDKIDVRAHSPAGISVNYSEDNWDWITITRVH